MTIDYLSFFVGCVVGFYIFPALSAALLSIGRRTESGEVSTATTGLFIMIPFAALFAYLLIKTFS